MIIFISAAAILMVIGFILVAFSNVVTLGYCLMSIVVGAVVFMTFAKLVFGL